MSLFITICAKQFTAGKLKIFVVEKSFFYRSKVNSEFHCETALDIYSKYKYYKFVQDYKKDKILKLNIFSCSGTQKKELEASFLTSSTRMAYWIKYATLRHIGDLERT